MSDQIISKDGYDKLKKELGYLIKEKRIEIAKRIEEAKELGDLSENAEYADAKEEQAFNEGRIIEISSLLKNLTIVDNSDSDKNKVHMGSKVTVSTGGVKKEYIIVSFNEADPAAGKISNESPLGEAFIGQKRGSKTRIKTPGGEAEYEILKVE